MGIEKYRVHEVAKDFGLPTKTITEILTKYAETPKNHMQALTDQELSLIFEYLTQHNQVSSIQTIFADTYKDAAKEAPAKKAEPAKSAAPGQGQGGSKQPAAKVPQNAQGGSQLQKAGAGDLFHSVVLPFFFFCVCPALASCGQKHYTMYSLAFC